MDKIKILHIGKYYHPCIGGFEASLYNVVESLKDKFCFRVLVSNTAPKTVIENDADLSVIRMACLGRMFSQPITPGIFYWLKVLKVDILHLHLPNPLAMIAYLIISPPGKLVVSYHNDILRTKIGVFFLKPFLIKILKKAEVIIVTSANLIESSPVLSKFHQKCRVIPHGVDVERFRQTPFVLEESRKIRNFYAKPVILFVGRLVYYKGLEYLIPAMKEIDAKLIIVGNGPLARQLKKLARKNNVEDKVFWQANVSDELLPVYYYACELLVLASTSNSEGFGMVILEAQASGRPVVSTALPTGVTFTNLDGVTGFTVPVRNSELLARAVNQLLCSEELRICYGVNGKQRVGQYFTKELMAEDFFNLYTSICRIA